MASPLTDEQIRRIAALSHLRITDAEVSDYRDKLGAIVDYVNRLTELDLRGVEPLVHIGDAVNRLRDDAPGPVVATDDLMRMAPVAAPPYVVVPKVIGDGSSA
ncbi:MAG: Asp-tRNA(Asn)/Glu-tRNA(Gln) amidotransferase subunit GatC [Phycisphaerae bacterium]|nr:Asp-tRNA(Asn)/Glu-tRNA(Gln) amidotransferase subunit GatC [Phycisphaerae bacterium]